MPYHRLLYVAALVTSLAWAEPAHPPGPLTADNFSDVADAVLETLDTSAMTLSTLMLGQIDIPPRHPWLARIMSPIAHARSFNLDCPRGGSVKGRLADRDRSEDLSERDRFVTTFSQCQFETGDPVGGRSEFVVTAHRLEGPFDVTELDCRFDELGTQALRWSGPASVVLHTDMRSGAERRVTTYRNLTARRGTLTYGWTLSVDTQYSPLGDYTARIDGTLTAPGLGPLTLRQDEPFTVGADGSPRTGRLTVTAVQGGRLRLEANGTGYGIAYFGKDNPGDVPDAQSTRRVGAP
jgi:hypothetical protein